MHSHLLFALKWFVIVALFVLSGCAPPPAAWPGPSLDSPNVTRVCVRPPNVPPNTQWWGLTEGGQPLLKGWEIAIAQENGLRVYYFDSDAPPESAQSLPIPHNELKCPARILPAARILPWKQEVVAKAPLEEEKPEAKEAKAAAEKPAAPKDPGEERFRQWAAEINQKKGIAAPPIVNQRPMPARMAAAACKEVSGPGQKRKRTSTSSCIRTKTLIHEVRAADPPAIAAPTSPRPVPKPLPEPVPTEYEPRRTQPPDLPGLDPDRVIECLNGVCHQRHQNFRPKGKTQVKPGDGQAWSTGGKGKPPASKTTVKTRTRPLSRPNKSSGTASPSQPAPKQAEPRDGQLWSKGGKSTGSGSGSSHEGKKIPEHELKTPPEKRGNAPTGSDGHPVELHHRGQKPDSPLDEMTRTDHRGKGNFKENHSNTGKEPSQIDRDAWKEQQKRYWTKEYDSGRFKKKQ